MRPLDPRAPRRILVRGTNWVGDAVMTMPALAALAQACPQARLEMLARPWVAALYQADPRVARVHILDAQGRHRGLAGRTRLGREMGALGFDWAVLLQNAFEAAYIALTARVPVRVGFATDGRRLLLTHPVRRAKWMRQVHETSYYLWMLRGAGLLESDPPAQGVLPQVTVSQADHQWAGQFLASQGLEGRRLLGLAPGAAFGPAKCWPAQSYADCARLLLEQGLGPALLFGSKSERPATQAVAGLLEPDQVLDLSGQTDLGQAMALLERLGLFITNDSGLMHVAAALGTPTLAIFGSTNPVTTGPLGPHTRVIRRPPECAPCKKAVCPTDLRCLTAITAPEVAQAGLKLLDEA